MSVRRGRAGAAEFLHRHFLWLLVGAYLLAGTAPHAGGWLSGLAGTDRVFGFAVRVARRAGVVVLLGAGPLVVAPELGSGVNSDPATRSGRALALQLLAAFVAQAQGLPPAQAIV